MERGALPPRLAVEPLRPAPAGALRTGRPAGKLRVPVDALSALLDRTSIRLFNALYYRIHLPP